jgi:predicted transposase/invertase (TIGR01784 family)
MQIGKDTLWKGIIEDLFEDFLLYFYPLWTKENVDTGRPFEFLDKELDEIYPAPKPKKRFADKLVKVHTKAGGEQWVLVHIEVQGYKDVDFPERMFTYFYRIRDRFRKEVMALVILTDDDPSFQPASYRYQFQNTSLEYRFDSFKLSTKTSSELEIPGNPFGIVMLTAWEALKKKDNTDSRLLDWKISLVEKLKEAGYEKEKIKRILNFIRYYIGFKEEKKSLEFEEKVQSIIKNRTNMGIEEAIKKEIREKSLKEGEKKNRLETAKKMKEEGFDIPTIARITGLKEQEINAL